jgi:hypothetical protein
MLKKRLEQIEKRSPVIDSAFLTIPSVSLLDCKAQEDYRCMSCQAKSSCEEKQVIASRDLSPSYSLAARLNFIFDCSRVICKEVRRGKVPPLLIIISDEYKASNNSGNSRVSCIKFEGVGP